MTTTTDPAPARTTRTAPPLSLFHLLDPEVLANPYPLYHRLRTEDPVHWDPFLHAWVVTRYHDVVRVLRECSAARTPSPEQLSAIGLSALNPLAKVMVKQMLFLDPPTHTRIRGLASAAFTPGRVEALRAHIREIAIDLIEKAAIHGRMDVIGDLAEPLPCIVTAEMLGVPVEDHRQLKLWSQDFAEMLGNFQHNPDHAPRIVKSTAEMTAYFKSAMRNEKLRPNGLVASLRNAEIQGDRLTEEEVIANCIVTMVGGQETTTNLIGNGILSLLRNPDQLQKLRENLRQAPPNAAVSRAGTGQASMSQCPYQHGHSAIGPSTGEPIPSSLIPSAVEELLRYEAPSQHTARLAPQDMELGGKEIRTRQALIAVMAAGNRDPERFPDPDRLDITRQDNRHLSFGWGAHFCFGAPLARIEGQIVFEELLARFPSWTLEPGPLVWRTNLGLRGLTALPVKFNREAS